MSTEILSPGGSFNSALHAIQGGADALYIGLKDFSARKKAENFTYDQIRRLRSAIGEKKIYLALNTVQSTQDLERLIPDLPVIMDLPVDAYILQDWGLFSFLKRHFPHKEYHGSTQMAVHNIHGARFLQNQGFRRVVLARELSFSEIGNIRTALPDLELEVFIHGAYCYGVSGLCLASGTLLGRSGNKGECGQICRTWFTRDSKRGFYFSARDIFTGEDVQELAQMGVTSLKIEGRMKSPEYARATAAYYKAILQGAQQETKDLQETMLTSFARPPMGTLKTTPQQAGHQGIPAGIVTGKTKGGYQIKKQTTLEPRDGLLYLDTTHSPPKRIAFGAQWDQKGLLRTKYDLPLGAQLYKISSSSNTLPLFKEASYKPSKTPLSCRMEWKGDKLHLTSGDFVFTTEITKEPSQGEGRWEDNLARQLSRSSESPYMVKTLTSTGDIPDFFVPPKELKGVRRNFFSQYQEFVNRKGQRLLDNLSQLPLPEADLYQLRSQMVDQRTKLPFFTRFITTQGKTSPQREDLFDYQGYRCLPLAPVQWKSEVFFTQLDLWLNQNPGKTLIGLSNPAHLEWATNHSSDRVKFFIDYGLYIHNPLSREYFQDLLGDRLLFCLPYIEGDRKDFNPPLFISRICQVREEHKGKCPPQCPRNFHREYLQQDKTYTLIIQDCLNYLFKKDIS